MGPDELLRTMRAALAEERDALRRLDVEGVTRATAAKERVLARMLETPPAERPPLIAALAELKNELRQNLVLLAHARDSVRDAIEVVAKKCPRPRLTAKL
jgi:hypothetical protein